MMATNGAANIEDIAPTMNNLELNGEVGSETSTNPSANSENKWSLLIDVVYKLALRFYKEKDGSKAVQLTYKERVKLVAYTKQVSFGKYRPDVSTDVGFLDVVGNDRRQAWLALGELTKTEAMTEFVRYLDQLCPLFTPYIDAHKAEQEEQRHRQEEEDERLRREDERLQLENEVRQRQDDDRNRQLQQELAIRAALNQQTAIQFKQYAEQQFPNNIEQQETLTTQLQEQHFQQYMQQVYQQQLQHQQDQYQQIQAMSTTTPPTQPPTQPLQPPTQNNNMEGSQQEVTQVAHQVTGNGVDPASAPGAQILQNNSTELVKSSGEDEDEDENDQNLPPIAAASMWTRKDVKEFKESIRKDPDSLIKVGSGETVTVRVPTHEDGTCLFWEFATDSYDIGFGVYFEWTIAPNNQVSVHVSESSDEDELEDEEGGTGDSTKSEGDLERGKKSDNRPPTDEIIPVYRRDCHEEVYCGSHMYPGRGVYLLKFDNSYSLWRSKSLYYRVYYTR